MTDDGVFDVLVKITGITTTVLRGAYLKAAVECAQYGAHNKKHSYFVLNRKTGVLKEIKPNG